MSRVGKLPVALPQGVKVQVTADFINVEGPKGKLTQKYLPEVEVKVEGQTVLVTRKNDTKVARSLHGLYRNLVNNMVIGVSQGYSTQMEYMIPAGITLAVENLTKIIVSGIDKAAVGQVAAEIRSIRPPEPYKGKGIKYETEFIRRKVGKSGIK